MLKVSLTLGIRGQAGGFGHGITNGRLGFSKGRIDRGLNKKEIKVVHFLTSALECHSGDSADII